MRRQNNGTVRDIKAVDIHVDRANPKPINVTVIDQFSPIF